MAGRLTPMTPADPLIDFVAAVSGESYLKVEEDLGDGYVRLRIAEAERRQAKHDIRSVEDVVVELLRNARDAHSQRIFVATHREAGTRSITVIDDGLGVPDALRERIFEPRVTSKLETMVMDRWGVHGRGMALFSVKSNVASARVAASGPHLGTSLAVVIDTAELQERADQSSWPEIDADEEGTLSVSRGPHNIARRVVEFALEHQGIDVYLGSPTEILATLFAAARDAMDSADLLFVDDTSRLPVWHRPAAASDASELMRTSDELAIGVSERSAHRVLAGELKPLEPVLANLLEEDEPAHADLEPDIYRDRRGLKIHHVDLSAFRRDLMAAFDTLGEKYYIHLAGEPKITVGRDDIRVRFHVEKED
jgi:anti-sigma regulatory factor (Ser/Thr protein kinase)